VSDPDSQPVGPGDGPGAPTPPIAGIALAALMLAAAIQYAWNAVGVPALTGYDAGPHAA
jgi:hypothetical protein